MKKQTFEVCFNNGKVFYMRDTYSKLIKKLTNVLWIEPIGGAK